MPRVNSSASLAIPVTKVGSRPQKSGGGGIGARDARVAATMTAADTTTIDLGRFGYFGLGATPDQAREIERLGYGTIWIGGSPPAQFSFVEPLLVSAHRA